MSQLASYSAPTKILLPIDFSSSFHAALHMATDLAQRFQAELCLLHVVPLLYFDTGNAFVPDPEFLQDVKNRTQRRLAACVAAPVAKGLKASSIIEIGNDVVGNIVSVVERERIDMMVLSTQAKSGGRAVVFGPIAQKIVKLVPCPLLLLHSPTTGVVIESESSSVMATTFLSTAPIQTA
jgi:nucleotide-binding universal stress UspA family protein